MPNIRNCARAFALLLLLTSAGLGGAQEAETVTVVGSRIVNALIAAVAEDGGAIAIDFETIGTTAGIDRFCNGDIDIAAAAREMTGAESAICAANDVVHSEFLIAHQIVAFVAHPDAPLACLAASELETALKPTSSNVVTDWSFYAEEHAELPLALIIPADNQIEYAIVDGLAAGDGLRRDARVYAEPAEAIALVRETAGALAILPWAAALAEDATISPLEFSGDAGGACFAPSAENVESGGYGAAQSLYVTVNRSRLDANSSLRQLMESLTDAGNAGAIAAAGFTPATSATYSLNAELLADADASLAADDGADAFVAPPDLSGSITIAGAANAHAILSQTGDQLSQQNQFLALNYRYAGRAAGIEGLCQGEAEITVLDAAIESGDLDACAAADAGTLALDFGSQATVLLAHAGDAHAACLTTEAVNAIWQGESAGLIADWSDIAADFPGQPLTLFGLTTLDAHTDILLQTVGGLVPPIRRDTEQDYDPLYRAAAVGNVAGALTYMSWPDYQRVLAGGQANIQLVAIDAGGGCVEPDAASVEDGAYPLARAASLLIREEALADASVQAYVWTLLNESNWAAVERQGFIGVSARELPALRRDMLRAFAEAEGKYPPAAAEDETEAGAADDSGASESG